MHVPKPTGADFNPYATSYISAAPEGDPVELLRDQETELLGVYNSITEEQGLYRYSDGKWSLKEILGHLIDTERMAAFRLLCAARGDSTPLPRHHQTFVYLTNFDRRPLVDLITEFRSVRAATLSLLQGLTEEELQRSALVNNAPTTAAALAYFIIGHTMHHMGVLRDRYMPHLQ